MGIVGAHRYMGENVPEVPDRCNLAAQTDKGGGGGGGGRGLTVANSIRQRDVHTHILYK